MLVLYSIIVSLKRRTITPKRIAFLILHYTLHDAASNELPTMDRIGDYDSIFYGPTLLP